LPNASVSEKFGRNLWWYLLYDEFVTHISIKYSTPHSQRKCIMREETVIYKCSSHEASVTCMLMLN